MENLGEIGDAVVRIEELERRVSAACRDLAAMKDFLKDYPGVLKAVHQLVAAHNAMQRDAMGRAVLSKGGDAGVLVTRSSKGGILLP